MTIYWKISATYEGSPVELFTETTDERVAADIAAGPTGSLILGLARPPFVHSEDPWMCHQGLAAAGFAASGLGVIAPGVFPEMVDAVPDSDPTTRIGDGFLLPIWRI